MSSNAGKLGKFNLGSTVEIFRHSSASLWFLSDCVFHQGFTRS